MGSATFWWKLGLSAGLVLLGGVFAGLTLGLMGLDVSVQRSGQGGRTQLGSSSTAFGSIIVANDPRPGILQLINLRVLSTSGTETEQKQAAQVLKLLERGRHWVRFLSSRLAPLADHFWAESSV